MTRSCMGSLVHVGWSSGTLRASMWAWLLMDLLVIRHGRWRWVDVTEKSLHEGIAQALPGKRVVDISRAIQNYVEGNGFSIVREFVGHGVGRTVHEDPQVPNFVDGKCRDKLKPGMTIAI